MPCNHWYCYFMYVFIMGYSDCPSVMSYKHVCSQMYMYLDRLQEVSHMTKTTLYTTNTFCPI